MPSFEEILVHTLIILFVLFLYYSTNYDLDKYFKNIPTPPLKFLRGNLDEFKSPSEFLKNLHKLADKYGDIFHLKLGPFKHMLVVSDPSFIHFVLNDRIAFKKSNATSLLRPLVGNGIILSEGDTWKVRRKLINPAFNLPMLKTFVDTFEACSDILITKLSEVSGSQNLDIYPIITRCAFDMICETAMGTKVEAQKEENPEYFRCTNEFLKICFARSITALKRYTLGFYFTQDYKIQKQIIKYLHEYGDNVINNKLKALKGVDNNDEDKETNQKKRKVFIDLLLDTASEIEDFSLVDVRDEVNAFMFAGHHTTSCVSSFVLYCLANHKDVQDKVYQEQQQIFGGVKNPKVTYASLQEMQYLDCVIKETMRIYSPVPTTGRETAQEVTYKGITIPKGVSILPFPHRVHMNPEFFPNPEKFDPSRFEDADEKLRFAYLPFGTGPRNCIGQKYAVLETKGLVAKIIRNFELTPAVPQHTLDLSVEFVLKSTTGFKIGLKSR